MRHIVRVIGLGLIAFLPVTCSINTMKRQAEDARLNDEARRLGGHATVPPGAAAWDGIGISSEISLSLSGSTIRDLDLERLVRLSAFRRVQTLSLTGTQITDEGMAILEGFLRFNRNKMVSVDLTETIVTEAKVRSVGKSCPQTNFDYGSGKSMKRTWDGP